jgi:hypothetical protein
LASAKFCVKPRTLVHISSYLGGFPSLDSDSLARKRLAFERGSWAGHLGQTIRRNHYGWKWF